ncbi:MAG: sulfite exporter TauE/SafE family protein, partial [Acidobacteria bacterium]|nr:sulfite exporter TauE/SafE family protein [Acidobacteriota bacterium]
MIFPLAAYLLTLLIGLSLGVLGAGGAILLLPVLVYVAGVAPPQAVPMSMAVMSVTSLVGALGYLRRGDVSLRLAVVFGLGGMAGALTVTHFTHLVPPRILMLIFAGVLLVVGTLMLTRRNALTCSQPCLPPRCFT